MRVEPSSVPVDDRERALFEQAIPAIAGTATVVVHVVICLLLVATGCQAAGPLELRDGDLIFHRSRSAQSDALERALKSPYTHMGVIFIEDGQPVVYEAVGTVKATPFDEWTARGQEGSYIVKRLKESASVLTPESVTELKRAVIEYEGKAYDLYFEWSDERIYCSELIWKAYNRAVDVEIGRLRRFGDHDFSDPVVRATLRERFGDKIPADELVISPADMFESDLLETVMER